MSYYNTDYYGGNSTNYNPANNTMWKNDIRKDNSVVTYNNTNEDFIFDRHPPNVTLREFTDETNLLKSGYWNFDGF